MISGHQNLRAQTDIIELNGSEKIAYFELNNSKCSANIPTNYLFDNTINLKLSVDDMYFFDKKTGINLLYC